MLIGVLSDSHGRAAITARAVAALRDAGAAVVLHLGDVETEAVIDELVGQNARLVFGNCDWEEQSLQRYAEFVGVQVDHPMGRFQVDGRTIAFTHGHIEQVMRDALADGVDYLLHGHTHTMRDERHGSTRVLNPGALFRASRYTALLLDPGQDRVQFLEIPRSDAT